MTSDELKAAVDRLQELLPDLRQCADDAESLPVTLGKDDVDALETVLASLPDLHRLRREMDETPVDEVWLESVGFRWISGETERLMYHDLRMFSFTDYKMVALDGADHYEMKTRGDVRRLCAALGITLKEPQP